MDEKDLKIIALKQRIGELTSDYEERIADLRVNITILEQRTADARADRAEPAEGEEVETVEGEVV